MENFFKEKPNNFKNSDEWKKKEKEIREKINELYSGEDILKNHKKITRFCKRLISKYGRDECLKVLAFHIAIGSTIPPEIKINYFDFTGKDSILRFINDLLKKKKKDKDKQS